MPKNNEDVCSKAPLQDMEGIYKFWVLDTFESITAYALERYKHKSGMVEVIERLTKLNQMCIDEEDDEPINLPSLRNFLAYFCYIDNCPRPSLTVSSSGRVYADWECKSSFSVCFEEEQQEPVNFCILKKYSMEYGRRIISGQIAIKDALQYLTVEGDMLSGESK